MNTYGGVFDLACKESRIEKLEKDVSAPGFWDNPELAQAKMHELSELRSEVDLWTDLSHRAADAMALFELAMDD